MGRRWVRVLELSSCAALLLSSGCDALTVRSFAGTVMQFTLANAPVTPAGQHLELWARDPYDDILRIDPYIDLSAGTTSFGFMIRQAISLTDPCIIDDKGNLLTSPDAYPGPVTIAGVVQTPEQQAKQIVDRINQLAGTPPLLAVLPYDPTPPPSVPAGATADERLQACKDYRMASGLTYVANPLQITAPAHGLTYGFVDFVSTTPPSNYNGFRIESPTGLKGVQELFFTTESAVVDPVHRGALYLTSSPTEAGRDVISFDLIHADPNDTASGKVSLYVDLDEAPAQF